MAGWDFLLFLFFLAKRNAACLHNRKLPDENHISLLIYSHALPIFTSWGGISRQDISNYKYLPISPCLVIGPAWIFKISNLACSFGRSISGKNYSFNKSSRASLTHSQHPSSHCNSRIFLSSLPGRRSAGSRVSGLLVAMIILTLCRVSNPSIWFNS